MSDPATTPQAPDDSARILDIALASTGAGVVVVGPDRCVTQLSELAARVTGWTEPEAIGQPCTAIFGADSTVAHRLAALLDDGAAPTLRQRMLVTSRQGVRSQVEVSTSPVRDREGRLSAVVIVMRDLQRLVDVEAQTRSAETRFQLVVQSAPSGLLIIDPAGTITLANHRAEAMLGYTDGELVGQRIERLLPERARAQHHAHRAAFVEAPVARAMGGGRDLTACRKDGTELPVEIGLQPLQTTEGLLILASVVDITERKRRDDELRRSNADLEQFAYIASHDLQEPLRMVASYTELLGERYKGRLDERADKYIFYAVDGARRMQRLIADLLAYSRVGSQGKPFLPVSMGPVAEHVLHVLRPAIEQVQATVTVGTLPRVLADEGQMHQLLQNLLSNALKFRSAAAPVIRVQALPERDHWVFTVQDNGIGIELRYAERIFQMFQRLHERGRYEGSGIGLAIAKRIVDRHGGTIGLDSQPGVGTTFFFTLPRVGTAELQEPAGPAGQPG